MNNLSHQANQQDQPKQEMTNTAQTQQVKADQRGQVQTPENSRVDVFEFEPNGFMSHGRW
jgi:hypothetical protein